MDPRLIKTQLMRALDLWAAAAYDEYGESRELVGYMKDVFEGKADELRAKHHRMLPVTPR